MPNVPRRWTDTPDTDKQRTLKRIIKDIGDSFWNPYDLFPVLREYTPEFLSPVIEILGVGNSGIIVKCLYSWGLVYKIPKTEFARSQIGKEHDIHDAFYIALRKGKKEKDPKKKIPDFIHIPLSPEKLKEGNKGYHLECVEWNSLHSLYLKKKFHAEITAFLEKYFANSIPKLQNGMLRWTHTQRDIYLDEIIEWLNDYQVNQILIKMWKIGMVKHIHDFEAYFKDPLLKGLLVESDLWMPPEIFQNGIQKFRAYCKEKWLEHKDLNGGNIMVGKNGNIYIIDFEIT